MYIFAVGFGLCVCCMAFLKFQYCTSFTQLIHKSPDMDPWSLSCELVRLKNGELLCDSSVEEALPLLLNYCSGYLFCYTRAQPGRRTECLQGLCYLL